MKKECSVEGVLDAMVAEYLSKEKVINPDYCETELDETIPLVAAVVKDLETKDITKLAFDAIQFLTEGEGILSDCKRAPTESTQQPEVPLPNSLLLEFVEHQIHPMKDLCTTDAEDGADMVFTIIDEVLLNNTVDPDTLVT
jgi:hypothetical protein